jgi:hypothetical protein
LNQSGNPRTAGIGRGSTASSSGGQRKAIVGEKPTIAPLDHGYSNTSSMSLEPLRFPSV